jgi:hypothetical protein
VAVVGDLLGLAAGHAHLRGIDDDDEVAVVQVGLVGGLVLALEQVGGLGGDAAERPAGGIDDVPVLVHLRLLDSHSRVHAVYPSSYQTF